jgi:hypothetical protein
MFGSAILDVAVGVVFGFLAISLFTSAAVEAINSYLKLRAVNLKSGVMALVNDPTFTGLAKQLYEHASISPFGPGAGAATVNTYQNKKALPSYIDKAQFARALMDVTGLSTASPAATAQAPGPAAIAAFNAQVAAIGDPQIRALVQGVVNRTSGDIKRIETEIGEWFDNGMDRLSGAFKRWTQVVTFLIALPIAVVFNMDSIRIGTRLWEQPSLADTLKSPNPAPQTEQDAVAEITQLAQAGLPVGWAPGHFFEISDDKGRWVDLWKSSAFVWSICGWTITAFAALFGAPFWFDTLQTFIRLKGAGPSPREKQDNTAAAG